MSDIWDDIYEDEWWIIIADDRVQWRAFTSTLLDLQVLLSERQLFEYWYHSEEIQSFLIT